MKLPKRISFDLKNTSKSYIELLDMLNSKKFDLRRNDDKELHDTYMQGYKLYYEYLREVEMPLFQAAMLYTRGSENRACKLLGINRTTLRSKLTQYGMKK